MYNNSNNAVLSVGALVPILVPLTNGITINTYITIMV